MTSTKECKKCLGVKPIQDFARRAKSRDGLQSRCKICSNLLSSQWHVLHKSTHCAQMYRYSLDHRYEQSQYYLDNKERILGYVKQYEEDHKAQRMSYRRLHQKYRMKDPLLQLAHSLRNRLGGALKQTSWTKGSHLTQYLGCTIPQLKLHLETQFQPGMTWTNHTIHGWHIDHIIPLSSATTPEELYKLCHYTNLQPLWATDNIQKSNKLS